MKKILRIPLLLVALLLSSIPLSAHDFSVDGIYYNITSSTATAKTVKVTYSGSSCSAVENEYTGSVVIPDAVTYSGITYLVTSIATRAFQGCTGLTEVTIGNSVTTIGFYAFAGCTGLTTVNFNATYCTSMSNTAFEGCTKFTKLNLGDNVTRIPTSAFVGCFGLTSVTIPNSVTKIGACAFAGCTGLTEITIPSSVTSIGVGAFLGCSGLTEITSLNPEPPTCEGDNVFSTVSTECILYVPAGCKDAYAEAVVWKNFTNIVELPESGVDNIEAAQAVEVARFDIHGRRLAEPSPGINIVKYGDGSTRKEIVK